MSVSADTADSTLRIAAYFAANDVRFRALLSQLVAIPSVSPNERPAQEWLVRAAEALGLDAETAPSDRGGALESDERFIPTGMPFADRPNVTVRTAGSVGALVLNAHVDVVEDGAGWHYDPSGEWVDDRLYGRGTCDTKASTIAALMAMACIKACGVSAAPVILHSVIDEEPGGNGTLSVVRGMAEGERARLVIVMEPSRLDVLSQHRGMLWYGFRADGVQGHGSTREGINAIEKAAESIMQISAANRTLSTELASAGQPAPSVTVGTVHGGTEPYTTPAQCRFDVTARYGVGDRDVVDTVVMAAAATGELPGSVQLDFVRDFDASATPREDAEALRLLQTLQTHRAEAQWGSLSGTCDMRHYRNVLGVPTVVFGPGDLGTAHGPNEYVDWADVVTAARVIVDLARGMEEQHG